MDRIIVNGGRVLKGSMRVSGAKNAALPIMAAAILARDKVVLENVPVIRDITSMVAVLRTLGAKVTLDKVAQRAVIDSSGVDQFEAQYELVKTMRASILVLGPLVATLGRAHVSLPGGCAIGTRPIDIHLDGLKALGAEIKLEHGYVIAMADRLKGGTYRMPFASVGATENLMCAAALAEGRSVLENCAREPEIEDLAGFINSMGGEVHGAGTETIEIIGKSELRPTRYPIMPDRIEAGTFLVAGPITGGDVVVSPMPTRHLEAFLDKLSASGVDVSSDEATQSIRARSSGRLKPIEVETAVHPGFPTDLQAQLMALSCITDGESIYRETIFENRFMHVAELTRMGARIHIDGRSAHVHGAPFLSGAEVMASDLRASAALILAGLVARGRTIVNRVYHIDRGYERFEEKLAKLGADIRRDRDTAN